MFIIYNKVNLFLTLHNYGLANIMIIHITHCQIDFYLQELTTEKHKRKLTQ